ncbi:MAG TPA: hypothetical protein PKY50_06035 [Candidatus Competibacter sp.]|nr:hypothetical protein [Candidatus Competibacter sp.]
MTPTSADIARASETARDKLATVERATIGRLLTLYRDAEATLVAELEGIADDMGNVRLDALREYLNQVRAAIATLQTAQRATLGDALQTAAELGASVWLAGATVAVIAESAARFVEHFVAADGLKLSDRLWRIENGAVQAIADTLRRAVVLGRDAGAAAADFLARGEAVPEAIRRQIAAGGVSGLRDWVRQALTTGTGNAYQNALRVFRTELNRAHGQAYQSGAAGNPDVIGIKFNLSPNHPRYDVCDVHARANLHGLGPGVYPVGRSPWPAHPNTMSYLTAVFRDEVSEADKAGQQDVLSYLRGLQQDQQEQVLGVAKSKALRAGLLGEGDIEKPWKELRDGFERMGYVFDK